MRHVRYPFDFVGSGVRGARHVARGFFGALWKCLLLLGLARAAFGQSPGGPDSCRGTAALSVHAGGDVVGTVYEAADIDQVEAERLFASFEAALYLKDQGLLRWFEPGPESGPAADSRLRRASTRLDSFSEDIEADFPGVLSGQWGEFLLKRPAVAVALPGSGAEGPTHATALAAVPGIVFADSFEAGLSRWVLADNVNGDYSFTTMGCATRTGGWSADPIRGGTRGQYLTCFEGYPASATTQITHAACDGVQGAAEAWLDFYFTADMDQTEGLGVYYLASDGYIWGYSFAGRWSGWFHVVANMKQWTHVGDLTLETCPKLIFQFRSDATGTQGVGASLDDVQIRTDAPAFLRASIDATPTGGPAPLAVSFSAKVLGSAGGETYQWLFGDAGGSTATTKTATFTYTTAGTYWARLRVMDSSGARAYAHVMVTPGSAPACTLGCAAAAPAAGTVGTAVSFQGTATPSGCSGTPVYSWDFGDMSVSTAQSPSHVYTLAGTYGWTFTTSVDGKSCAKTGSITITAVPTSPTLALGNASGPAGGTVTVPVSFSSSGAAITAVSLELPLGPSLSLVSATAGAAASAAAKLVGASQVSDKARLIVYGLNQTRLGDGEVARLTLAIRPGTPQGSIGLAPSKSAGSDASGRLVAVSSRGGTATVSGSVAAGTSLLVPVILSLGGAAGSFYTTELTLTNRGSAESAATLDYTAALSTGSGSATVRLAAGRQLIVPDAIEYLRTLGVPIPSSGSRLGTLRVTSASAGIAATARTSTKVPEGRAGLAYPGVADADLLGSAAYLCGLRKTAADRSNVAVVNAGGPAAGNVRFRLTARSGNPAAPGSGSFETEPLAPGGWLQLTLDDVLSRTGLPPSSSNVFVKVERSSGSAPFYAYGVINDAGTSDGSFVFPVPERTMDGKSSLVLPVVVETAAFQTEVMLTNFSSSARTLRLTYVAGAVTAPGNAAAQTLTLQAGEQKILPGFVAWLRASGTAGVPAAGPTFAGALLASATSGDVSGIVLGARTSSPGGAGRYGLFYGGIPNGSAASSAVWLYGLQQNTENRTNVAFVNTGEQGASPITLRLEVWDGATGRLVTTIEGPETTLDPKRFGQLDRILLRYAPGVTQGYVRVSRSSGQNPFVTYAVINDGAEPGQRSGDGAYVPMVRE